MRLMDLLPTTKTKEDIIRNRRKEARDTLAWHRQQGNLSEDKDSVARFLIRLFK